VNSNNHGSGTMGDVETTLLSAIPNTLVPRMKHDETKYTTERSRYFKPVVIGVSGLQVYYGSSVHSKYLKNPQMCRTLIRPVSTWCGSDHKWPGTNTPDGHTRTPQK